jgi:hypothetical protein
MAEETGWLIEMRGGQPKWAAVNSSCGWHWTMDASEAVRFSREKDANAVRSFHFLGAEDVFVSEHGWG